MNFLCKKLSLTIFVSLFALGVACKAEVKSIEIEPQEIQESQYTIAMPPRIIINIDTMIETTRCAFFDELLKEQASNPKSFSRLINPSCLENLNSLDENNGQLLLSLIDELEKNKNSNSPLLQNLNELCMLEFYKFLSSDYVEKEIRIKMITVLGDMYYYHASEHTSGHVVTVPKNEYPFRTLISKTLLIISLVNNNWSLDYQIKCESIALLLIRIKQEFEAVNNSLEKSSRISPESITYFIEKLSVLGINAPLISAQTLRTLIIIAVIVVIIVTVIYVWYNYYGGKEWLWSKIEVIQNKLKNAFRSIGHEAGAGVAEEASDALNRLIDKTMKDHPEIKNFIDDPKKRSEMINDITQKITKKSLDEFNVFIKDHKMIDDFIHNEDERTKILQSMSGAVFGKVKSEIMDLINKDKGGLNALLGSNKEIRKEYMDNISKNITDSFNKFINEDKGGINALLGSSKENREKYMENISKGFTDNLKKYIDEDNGGLNALLGSNNDAKRDKYMNDLLTKNIQTMIDNNAGLKAMVGSDEKLREKYMNDIVKNLTDSVNKYINEDKGGINALLGSDPKKREEYMDNLLTKNIQKMIDNNAGLKAMLGSDEKLCQKYIDSILYRLKGVTFSVYYGTVDFNSPPDLKKQDPVEPGKENKNENSKKESQPPSSQQPNNDDTSKKK